MHPMRALLLLVAVVAVGCGPQPLTTSLNPEFLGTWAGTLSVAGASSATSNPSSHLSLVQVGGDIAQVACPDDSGLLTLEGSGNLATWAGEYDCGKPVANCSGMRAFYKDSTLELKGGTLTMRATYVLTGCSGAPTALTYEFSGTK